MSTAKQVSSFVFGLSSFLRRHTTCVGILMVLVGTSTLFLLGCGSPQQRYKTLSVFFDGVPNPDAPKKGQKLEPGQVFTGGTRIVSQHKPYLDNRCAECHQTTTGDIQEFDLAYNACVKCHKKVDSEHPLMHGPVARDQCKWCHAPHQSTEPYLLKDTPIKVCTQCHDKQLLGNNPPEHTDGTTSCLSCHFGHGGTARYFIKSAAATNPATQPATEPATQSSPMPATAPATEPALSLPRKDRAP